MSEHIWEQFVETYLAIDRGLFLNPQYLIGTPGEWEANPDFLAICFPEKTAWMVEVTTQARRLYTKIDEFSEYTKRIRVQLIRHNVIPKDDDDWKIGFWAFVLDDSRESIDGRLKLAGISPKRATSLEEAMKPPWAKLFRV